MSANGTRVLVPVRKDPTAKYTSQAALKLLTLSVLSHISAGGDTRAPLLGEHT